MLRVRARAQGKRQRRGGGLGGPLALAALVGASALLLLWPHLRLLQVGYEFQRLRAGREALARENRLLRVEASTLRQMPRIEAIARKRLGMVFPEPGQVVLVRPRTPEGPALLGPSGRA
ncbi:MAG: cell division protein FtsL, partial [Nitrospinota bacterium]